MPTSGSDPWLSAEAVLPPKERVEICKDVFEGSSVRDWEGEWGFEAVGI